MAPLWCEMCCMLTQIDGTGSYCSICVLSLSHTHTHTHTQSDWKSHSIWHESNEPHLTKDSLTSWVTCKVTAEWRRQLGSHTVSSWIIGTGHNRSKSRNTEVTDFTILPRFTDMTETFTSIKCKTWEPPPPPPQCPISIPSLFKMDHSCCKHSQAWPLLFKCSIHTKSCFHKCPKFSALLRHDR